MAVDVKVMTSSEQPFGHNRSQPRADDGPEALTERVRAEYREMPGLCLTVRQACRLWQIDPTTCTHLLEVLVAEHYLRRTPTGAFMAETW